VLLLSKELTPPENSLWKCAKSRSPLGYWNSKLC